MREQETATEPATDNRSREERIAAINYPPCSRCTTGVMHVILFDPDSTHEHGQGSGTDFELSGGAVQYRCFACDWRESRPLPGVETAAVDPAEQGGG